MIDLSSFSNMFPSLSSFFDRDALQALAPRPAAPAEESQETEQDSVELSEPARRGIPSGTSSSTFDTIPDEEPTVAVAEDGTYAPTSSRSLTTFGFSFNMSIQRSVTTYTRQSEDRSTESGSAARLAALESRSLYYQSVMNESRGRVAGGYQESRSVQTELFYSRTRQLSLSLPSDRAQQLDETSTQVARRFELSISMDFSFLGQFTRQSESISSLDDDLFGSYLDTTGGLSQRSADVMQSFFDDVDRTLESSEAYVKESLASLFDQVRDQFGLSDSEAGELESFVLDEVSSFFDEVDTFLSEARSGFSLPSSEPAELPDPAEELPPAEEDPAAILA